MISSKVETKFYETRGLLSALCDVIGPCDSPEVKLFNATLDMHTIVSINICISNVLRLSDRSTGKKSMFSNRICLISLLRSVRICHGNLKIQISLLEVHSHR